MRGQEHVAESLINFVTPVELILRTNSLICPAPTAQQYRFKYPFLKVMEISNASQVLLSQPAAGSAYRGLGGRGVALSLGQILIVQPGEVYEFGCRLQLGDQLVLWNHPDLSFLSQMNAGAIAPIVRVLNQVIPSGQYVDHDLWIDSKVCSVEFHFWFAASLGGPYDLTILSMTEEVDYSLSPWGAPITPITIYTALAIPAGTEHSIGLNKFSTIQPITFTNIAQSRVFGRWLRINVLNLAEMAPGELTQINIKLNQHST